MTILITSNKTAIQEAGAQLVKAGRVADALALWDATPPPRDVVELALLLPSDVEVRCGEE